jgi:shikimate kinase
VKRHVVLVGLPGSGKSTVGRLAAGELGGPFVDLDEWIEQEQGQSVRSLFAGLGEAAFRQLERAAMRRALAGEPAIVAPGGGWAAQPGALEESRPGAFIIYLVVPVEVAERRCGPAGSRPLLAGGTVGERLTVLYEERAPFYERADVVVSNAADTPGVVARLVADLSRRMAGW